MLFSAAAAGVVAAAVVAVGVATAVVAAEQDQECDNDNPGAGIVPVEEIVKAVVAHDVISLSDWIFGDLVGRPTLP